MPTLDVIFRKDREDGSIIAVFPSEPGAGAYDVTIYTRRESHSVADPLWVRERTVPASPEECAPLLAELRSIYERPGDPERVTLRPVKRFTAVEHKGDRAMYLRQAWVSAASENLDVEASISGGSIILILRREKEPDATYVLRADELIAAVVKADEERRETTGPEACR